MHRYWFRPKRYCYGAMPVTWEGWTLAIPVAVIVAGSILGVNRLVDRSDGIAWLIWAACVAAMTFWFVQIARRRTEGGWRWGAGNKS